MSSEATQLKLRPLELKEGGDIEGAKETLARARAIEFESVTAEELTDPGELKRLAVFLKRRGDIPGAKAALARSKLLMAGAGSTSASSPSLPSAAEQLSARIPCLYNAATPLPNSSAAADPQQGQQQSSDADADSGANPYERAHETGDPADDGRDTNYLAQQGTTEAELAEELEPSGPVQFDDDELANEGTMAEFREMGMDFPTEEFYTERVKANKIAAVAAKKRGDMASAKAHLVMSKKLEATAAKLYAEGGEEESDDGLDYSLLDELMQDEGGGLDDDAFLTADLTDDSNTMSLDELDDFDAPMLKDMMEVGMEVPSVDEVMKTAEEKKRLALSLHKEGNKVGATAALAESKKLASQGQRLSDMLDAIREGKSEDPDDMDALEAMLDQTEGKPAAARSKSVPAESQGPLKGAEEYKREAVRFKQEGKLTDATKSLRLYKKALAEEDRKREMEECRALVEELNSEIVLAREQQQRHAFYERFVDVQAGAAQLCFWRRYASNCSKVITVIQAKGTKAVKIARTNSGGGNYIHNEDLGFVGGSADPHDARMELTIMDVMDIRENKHLKKILRQIEKEQKENKAQVAAADKPSLRIDVTIQLPPSEKESDSNISLSFHPLPEENNGVGDYNCGISQYVQIARGDSRFAKTIRRRMERKRIQFAVTYVPPQKKKSFFKKNQENGQTETSLGYVAVDLKDFLGGNFIAGDFPIMDSVRRNELGGRLRLCIRTGIPFDPAACEAHDALQELVVETPSTAVDFTRFDALSFS
jgi:hypothetical protein